ncbi:MAG: hypothetical protein M5U19_06235 [Microthrixaceae bacterium]|nr:hypothetical protein [Microthrixaceae bacterium]
MARIMVEPVNLLVLDEPTNHLDLPSCDVLEDALVAYPGTVLLVTHDRYLIREVADALVVVKDGRAVLHEGVDEELLAPSGATSAAAPATPVASGDSRAGTAVSEASGDGESAGRRENRAEVRRRTAAARQRDAAETREVRKRVQRLERQVAKAEAEVERIGAELADPDIYDDHQRVRALADEHDMAKERAESLMSQWMSAQEELETAGS